MKSRSRSDVLRAAHDLFGRYTAFDPTTVVVGVHISRRRGGPVLAGNAQRPRGVGRAHGRLSGVAVRPQVDLSPVRLRFIRPCGSRIPGVNARAVTCVADPCPSPDIASLYALQVIVPSRLVGKTGIHADAVGVLPRRCLPIGERRSCSVRPPDACSIGRIQVVRPRVRAGPTPRRRKVDRGACLGPRTGSGSRLGGRPYVRLT